MNRSNIVPALWILVLATTILNGYAAYQGFQQTEALNVETRSAWQRNLDNNRAILAAHSPSSLKSELGAALLAYINWQRASKNLDALNAKADAEIGTMQGLTDESDASDLMFKVNDLKDASDAASQQYETDKSLATNASSEIKALTASGPSQQRWTGTPRLVVFEAMILLGAAFVFVLFRRADTNVNSGGGN